MSSRTRHDTNGRALHRLTHPLDVSYLVVGLVFLGVAGFWALNAAGTVDLVDARWLLPLVLVGAGTVGLVGFAVRSVGAGREADDPSDPAREEPDQDAGWLAPGDEAEGTPR